MPRDCSSHIPVLYLHSIVLSPINLVSAALIPAPRNNLNAKRLEQNLGQRANATFSSQMCQTSESPKLQASARALHRTSGVVCVITFPKGALSPMVLTAGVARNTSQGRIAGRTQIDFVPGSPANALRVRFGFAIRSTQVIFLLGGSPSS
ncbi:hypothetical protein COCSADRAFT_37841 [Bipolaris sorokiniana ND90Pr]|uniref:Uncharacterized protein n=1 Tax=Cochliobolus sativus (strain ND90Pr / ATCC 201652) TaxID=665912 RepID=M2S745_COCSN|nr:uncharacterized protein COCSADRAFT_37841 [Bipolaris sorokiniana ND90Pr]EMD62963.1 hypothetical protein COCSADRAFT_37841 [Bipolaris sorokiniana ND90Pr]